MASLLSPGVGVVREPSEPSLFAQHLAQGGYKVHDVTRGPCVPRTVLGDACCPSIIDKSVPFYSQKCLGLNNKLYGHLVIHVK